MVDEPVYMPEMEERTQIMLNAMPLCCNLWTPEFRNMSCNDEAVRLFELSSQTEYLERFDELSPEYQPCGKRSGELAAEYIKKAFQDGYCRFEWLHQKLDGTPIPAEITLVRIRYKDGFIVSGYTRDLREQKAMLAQLRSKEDDLRTARDEALLSSKAKSNFLANMSHEIRTPMNAISGLAELILRESSSEKITENARGIKGACSNLMNIINDILDISKIESGKLEIFSSPYELASLLHDVITMSRVRLGSKQLMFITDIDSTLPAKLVGDEIRIKQILINMLSNAIKFTQDGFIALRVSGTVEGGRALLQFSVIDSGSGIKAEDQERLFAEFERVNTTKNRSIEGTGLGLAISKQLCEMMNGSIEVHSTFSKGSEFIVTIPQECPAYERLAEVKQEKQVLLFEPREKYRSSIAETLGNLGCRAVICANQSQLYENIVLKPYDYIIAAALHLKKVQSLVKKYALQVPVAVLSDYGEAIEDDTVSNLLFPIHCLQLANLLNGQHEDEKLSRYHEAGIHFTAPSARVLVVDDNPVNLHVAQGLMEPYGFTIDTAVNGREAVAQAACQTYDLIFMDHMMPEMDGIDATAAIRKLEGQYYKELPIVALTANAIVGTREMFIKEGMNDFLAKPIDMNKLGSILLKWLPSAKVIRTSGREVEKTRQELPEWDIAGVNTIQGIRSVGGSRENYLRILTVYHADGREKSVSLPAYLEQRDFAAFRTQVHALKSTSATIGAAALSSLAAELEEAAGNNDGVYLENNLEEFLCALKEVLASIGAILPARTEEEIAIREMGGGERGDLSYLKKILPALCDAAEFADIIQIESYMNGLQPFRWPDEVEKELAAIRECQARFDYDGIFERVEALEELLA